MLNNVRNGENLMALRPGDQIVHKAAWLYYTHGLRQDEVAKRLNISRASVAMYLRKARDTGIVTIATSTELFASDTLARQLEDRFGLAGVWIADGDSLPDPEAEIPALGASVFLSNWWPRATVSASPGGAPSTHRRRNALRRSRGVTVVELCGNLGAPYSYRPDQCTMEIARRLNAKGHQFLCAAGPVHRGLAQELQGRTCHPRAARRRLATASSRSSRLAASTRTAMS
jgi:DNA-binding transcriptional regulator LsrR (DeoR family)